MKTPLEPTATAGRRARRGTGRQQLFPRRHRPNSFVRRGVLTLLLIASLALLTVSYRNGENALQGPQMIVVEAVAPIERGFTRAWQPIESSYDWTTRLLHATNENPKLEERVAELETQLAVSKSAAAELEDLRDLLAIKERGTFPNGYDQVMGGVISKSNTQVDHSMIINLGSSDGVSVNNPVMVTAGLIGRVVATSPHTARIELITNQSQAVSAIAVKSRAGGVLKPISNEGSSVMELAFVAERVNVRKLDEVVTSGWVSPDQKLSSLYPRGIPIGVVTSVGSSPGDLNKSVQVTPYADFDRIDRVIVLVPTEETRKLTDYGSLDDLRGDESLDTTGVRPNAAAEAPRRKRTKRQSAATEQPTR